MKDDIEKIARAAKRANGYLDLGLKQLAIEQLEAVLTDEFIEKAYNEDMEEACRERLAGRNNDH